MSKIGYEFWRKVRRGQPEECWGWQGAKRNGYGEFRGGRATRFVYKLVNGELPAKAQVLHRCDNPSCVNPAHLFLGDHKANAQDRAAKGRMNHPVPVVAPESPSIGAVGGNDWLAFSQAAQRLGVTRQRVWQITNAAGARTIQLGGRFHLVYFPDLVEARRHTKS